MTAEPATALISGKWEKRQKRVLNRKLSLILNLLPSHLGMNPAWTADGRTGCAKLLMLSKDNVPLKSCGSPIVCEWTDAPGDQPVAQGPLGNSA